MYAMPRKKSWFRSPVITLVLLVVLGLAGLSVVRAFAKEREAAVLRNQYRNELDTMNERQATLEQQINSLSTERGIEAEIRDRYRVAKPGEELVIIVNNGENSETKHAPSWWAKFRLFIGI